MKKVNIDLIGFMDGKKALVNTIGSIVLTVCVVLFGMVNVNYAYGVYLLICTPFSYMQFKRVFGSKVALTIIIMMVSTGFWMSMLQALVWSKTWATLRALQTMPLVVA